MENPVRWKDISQLIHIETRVYRYKHTNIYIGVLYMCIHFNHMFTHTFKSVWNRTFFPSIFSMPPYVYFMLYILYMKDDMQKKLFLFLSIARNICVYLRVKRRQFAAIVQLFSMKKYIQNQQLVNVTDFSNAQYGWI